MDKIQEQIEKVMDEFELSPCPFCGSYDVSLECTEFTPLDWWIECLDCFSSGPIMNTPRRAAVEWNKRK